MAAGTATLEDTESECIRSFILADHDKATQLLPSLHQPAAVRTSYTFTLNASSTLCKNVSLLHLAALHGWMDIVTNLVNMYDSDCECRDDKEITPLHYAALGGSLPVVKYLITEMKCNPKSPGVQGRTPFHYACNNGYIDIINYLITEHGCDPAVPDNDSGMPIHIACLGGQLNVVKYLITEMKCNPKSSGYKGRTPLHYACGNGYMDIIKYLITEQDCDPSVTGNDGDMPINIACLGGHLIVVKYLITEMKCNPSSSGYNGRTPLHNACGNGYMDIIKFLISEQDCDPVILDNDGDMPIHIACLGGQLNVVKYLITEMKCNPNSSGYSGRTPLHQACGNGHMDIVKYLIFEQDCDPVILDNDGDMPIHIACLGGQLNVVKYLITEMKCNPKSSGYKGQTPLHQACEKGHMDIIKYLITNKDCVPALLNNKGNMPINIACLGGHLNVVKYLINEMKCNPKSSGYKGQTPLHQACDKGHMDIIKYLITEQDCDPAVPDSDGDMPIHIACLGGQLNVVKYLITEMKCNPKSSGYKGQTPLHQACDKGHMDIVKYLITEQDCDPAVLDNNGMTPLHYASYYGHTSIVQWLLQDGRVDPFSVDEFGRSAVNCAEQSYGRFDLLKLFQPLLDSHKAHPIHLLTKAVLTGNSGAGKSSLAQGMIELDVKIDFFQRILKKPVGVEQLTAGIISHRVENKKVKNMILFDLAGHTEYYFSQSAIMEVIIRNSMAVFVNLVDLGKSEEEITHAVHYWLNFIEDCTCKSNKKSFLIMVGSHADKISKAQQKHKELVVTELVKMRVTCKNLQYVGFVSLDCRYFDGSSESCKYFLSLVSECHHSILARAPSVSMYCHLLYAFLQTKVACQLKDVISSLSAEDSPIPLEVPLLDELLESLSSKGAVMYFRNKQCLEKSWILVKTEIILKDVNGVLFAPEHFKEHRHIASSTGVIRVSSLRQLFPMYDPEMLVKLLVSLEFCLPVNLPGIETNLQATSSNEDEADQLLFFPALSNTVRPQSFVIEIQKLSTQQLVSGWCLGFKDYKYQYFTARFLYTLIFRLSCTFPSLCENLSTSHSLHGLERKCTVWINGISWNNEDGIRTVVEVIQQNRWVVVTMYHNKDITRPVEYSKHRSAVIRLVLELQKELAHNLDTFECLISPSLLQQWPLEHLPVSDLFAIKDVAKSILLHKPVILSCKNDSNQLSTEAALLFEPYHLLSSSSVCELMESDQPVSSALLNEVRECCQQPQLESQSHLSLREHLDSMSIFTGRNPLVSRSLYT